MPVRVEQTPDLAPGHARLRGQAPDGLAAEEAEIRIARVDGGSPRFLDPRYAGDKAWGAAECWIRPEGGVAGPGLTLGPSATWHLKPHMPYLVAFRDAAGKVIEDRMSWPAIRLPSDAPPPSAPESATTAPPDAERDAEAAGEDPLAHFAEMAADAREAEPDAAESGTAAPPVTEPSLDEARAPAGRRVRFALLVGLLLILVAVSVLAFYEPGFLLSEEDTVVPPSPVVEGPPLTLVGARTFLQSDPPPDKAWQQAARFDEAGQADAAFLLTKYAAEAGDAEAALRLGDLYNPATWSEGGILKAPNAQRAFDYYGAAAEAGVVEAMQKLAGLLESGAVDLDDAPERAEFWRRKAEEAGKASGEVTK